MAFILIFLLFACSTLWADSLLVTVLMVKNEAPVIEKTLQPLVDAGITDFLIYDTQSTDDTIQVTQAFFIKNNISNFVIVQEPWIDFAASRNRALALAEQYFPEATFLLMPDAEWILQNGQALLAYCKEHMHDLDPIYFIKFDGSEIIFYHARLIRARSGICFVGRVHEVPNVMPEKKLDESVYFVMQVSEFGLNKTNTRVLRDYEILHQENEKYPNNPRILFFLAQACAALGKIQEAITWYEQRMQIVSFDEEYYLTHCFLAQAYEQIGQIEKKVELCLKAFNLRPYRAEPLVMLALYFYEIEQYHLSYLFARHACTLPFPIQDVSLINNGVYRYLRYALASATAYLFDDYEFGKGATLQALKVHPDYEFLLVNLEYYQKMLDGQ
jgi:glycosyltransferase involved in cell wall biosynthesis